MSAGQLIIIWVGTFVAAWVLLTVYHAGRDKGRWEDAWALGGFMAIGITFFAFIVWLAILFW